VTFPEQYGSEKLAGKTASFEVEVSQVEAPVLPEIDEEFIKAYGIEDGAVASFREDVRNNMSRELERALREKLKNAVMDELYAKIQISIPTCWSTRKSKT